MFPLPIVSISFTLVLQFTNYEVVAEGYGGKGFKLDRSNEDNMEEVLREAQRSAADGNSVLINCLIGKTNFREGSISV